MKKSIFLILICTFILGGCSSDKNKKLVCEVENEIITSTNTVEYSGKEVKKQTITEKSTVDKLGGDKGLIKEAMNQTKQLYNIDGLSFDYSIDGKSVVGTTTVDYTKADFEKLEDLGIISSVDENGKKVKTNNIDTVKKALENFGYTCK